MTYTNYYAKLAASGVNVINIIPIDEKVAILFEYSWRDPEQNNKLHWNKNYVVIKKASDNVAEEILHRVNAAREELERGE